MQYDYQFTLPIRIGSDPLNLNNYRNNHYRKNAKHKKEFYPLTAERWKGMATWIDVEYCVYKKTKRRYDTMNIVSVVDKYFLDWLVNSGMLIDDTCNNVTYSKIRGVNDAKEDQVIAYVKVWGF